MIAARLARALVVGGFTAALAYEAIAFFQFPRDLGADSTFVFEAIILAAACVAALLPAPGLAAPNRLALGFFVLTFTALVPFAFSQSAFGTHDVQSLLITARENRLGEMAAVGLGSFSGRLAEQAFALTLAVFGAWLMLRRLRGATPLLAGLGIVLLLINPLTTYLYRQIVPNPAYARLPPPQAVLSPQIVERPLQKRNLVVVYLESIEGDYRDIPATTAAFAPLAGLEDRARSLRNIRQLDETGFTAGGLVASQCGVPLYPRGVFHVRVKSRDTADANADFSAFLDKVTCLGDILTADGYVASYMNGSDLAVFSKGDFFRSHGYSRLFGRGTDPAYAADPRQNLWGLNDEVLFEAAGRELGLLAADGRPFVLSLLTVSTHGPDAMLDKSCDYPTTKDSGLPAAINCTGQLVANLVDEIGRLGLADNTVVAVMSDHLAMRNTLEPHISAFESGGGTRRNFAILLAPDSAPARIEKAGTMIDMFPTLLDALGYSLAGGRANMGTSLLGPDPTLREQMGLDGLNAAVGGNFNLQSYLWDGQASP